VDVNFEERPSSGPEEPVREEMRHLQHAIRDFHTIPGCETGGPLHIVTDDGNVEDRNLDFCFDALFDRLASQHEIYDGNLTDIPARQRLQDRGWWRKHQNPEDTALMIELGAKILWGLRGLSEDDREIVCERW
jgi:hypothetical protein